MAWSTHYTSDDAADYGLSRDIVIGLWETEHNRLPESVLEELSHYEVEEVDFSTMYYYCKETQAVGCCDWESKKLIILSGRSLKERECTALHEYLHAILISLYHDYTHNDQSVWSRYGDESLEYLGCDEINNVL